MNLYIINSMYMYIYNYYQSVFIVKQGAVLGFTISAKYN